MHVKKLDYYLAAAKITLRSDHLPLKKFLKQRTGNTKVNSWALSWEEYDITFEYTKGIKNTLADAMSRLVHINPATKLEPEPEGFEFGELRIDDEEVNDVETQEENTLLNREKSGAEKFVITVKEDDLELFPEIQLT